MHVAAPLNSFLSKVDVIFLSHVGWQSSDPRTKENTISRRIEGVAIDNIVNDTKFSVEMQWTTRKWFGDL